METEINNLSNQLILLLYEKGPNILLALLTLGIGWWLINFLTNFLKRNLKKANSDISELSHFLSRLVNIVLKVMLFISVASMIGIETTSFIAVLGAAGLAVGLALQGSLANFAGGVLIIVFKPYKVGDFIDSSGVSGTVKSIDILHTVLNTPDNKIIIVPNGQLSNNSITNFSKQETRRLDFNIGVGYNTNINTARKVILDALSNDTRILNDPKPAIYLTSLDDSSINISTRVWVKTPDYWDVFFENLENIKIAFDNNQIEIPFPKRDVYMK